MLMPTTKTPELVARLMHSGGKVLIVGGGTNELPDSIACHPQVLIWDDEKDGIRNREVPTNVKVIMYNRWVSHMTAQKLHEASVRLHALKFPMLKTREIKELLYGFIQAEPLRDSDATVEKQVEEIIAEEPVIQEEVVPEKPSTLREFVAKYVNISKDYTIKGTMTGEAKRLHELSGRSGFKTTQGSIMTELANTLRKLGKGSGIKRGTQKLRQKVERVVGSKAKTNESSDDFEQLNVFINDAIAAMKLVQEHLPKVQHETERLRAMRARFLKMLEE